jgi:hypothetical protein
MGSGSGQYTGILLFPDGYDSSDVGAGFVYLGGNTALYAHPITMSWVEGAGGIWVWEGSLEFHYADGPGHVHLGTMAGYGSPDSPFHWDAEDILEAYYPDVPWTPGVWKGPGDGVVVDNHYWLVTGPVQAVGLLTEAGEIRVTELDEEVYRR